MQIYQALSARDARFRGEPVTIPEGPNKGGLVVYLTDPDDNNLELIELPSRNYHQHRIS